VTAGVVTPNIVAATTGRRSPAGSSGAVTMPAIAAAALARTRSETELRPATSVTAGAITTSLTST
jgi:hypothetical protein